MIRPTCLSTDASVFSLHLFLIDLKGDKPQASLNIIFLLYFLLFLNSQLKAPKYRDMQVPSVPEPFSSEEDVRKDPPEVSAVQVFEDRRVLSEVNCPFYFTI